MKLRNALESKIEAMPGSRTKKQMIVDAIAYTTGAAVGVGAMILAYHAGTKSRKDS